MKIIATVPTYNERANIRVLVPKILEIFRKEAIDGGVLIIDDDSPDGTGVVAEAFAKNTKMVFVLRRRYKMGIGSAYKDGFKYALSVGGDGVIELDADLSHNPSYIPEFVKKLREGYDLVIGSRYIPGGKTPKWPLSRRVISVVTNRITKIFLGLSPKDVTSGYRAYSHIVLKNIDFNTVISDGYAFQVEMILRCQELGLNICEIPIAFVDRKEGESKLSRREMWQYLKSIVRLALARF